MILVYPLEDIISKKNLIYALRRVSHNLKFISCKIKDQWSSYRIEFQKDMIVEQNMPKEIFDNI